MFLRVDVSTIDTQKPCHRVWKGGLSQRRSFAVKSIERDTSTMRSIILLILLLQQAASRTQHSSFSVRVFAKDGLNSRSAPLGHDFLPTKLLSAEWVCSGGTCRRGDANATAQLARGGSTKEVKVKATDEVETGEGEQLVGSEDVVPGHDNATTDDTTDTTEEMQVTATPVFSHPEESMSTEEVSTPPQLSDAVQEHQLEHTSVATTHHSSERKFLGIFRKNSQHKSIAKKLKNRNHMNIRRKVMHACFGLGFAFLNHVIPKRHFVPGMVFLSTATLLMELLRYKKGFGWMNDALHGILGSSLRKHEMEGKFTGSFYFFTGVTVTAALFPRSAASLGMAQLALADPSASYFGRATRHVYWSRIENGLGGIGRNKGFLGFLGGALFCVPYNYYVLRLAKFGTSGIPGGHAALLMASFALGLAGAFADLAVPTPALTLPKRVAGIRVPPFHVDDNFVVPIVSAWACTKVFAVLQWPADLELARWMVAP